jgi:hypothetical protein
MQSSRKPGNTDNTAPRENMSSKWSDPSLGIVSVAELEAHAPRVPRGRFGIRPFKSPLRRPMSQAERRE